MKEKGKSGNIIIGMCIFVVIILVVAIIYLSYKYKTDMNSKNEEIEKLNSVVEEKNEKINSLNEKESNLNVNDEENGSKKLNLEDDKLGIYVPLKNWPGDAPAIEIQENGKIYSVGNVLEEGNYIYDGEELQVNYFCYTEPDEGKKIDENINSKIKFIDEDIIEEYIFNGNNTGICRYLKQELYEKIYEKAKECVDNQDDIKVESMGIFDLNDNECICTAYIEENGKTDLKYIILDIQDDEYIFSKIIEIY